MPKVIDISNTPRSIETIRLMNKDNLFKEIRIYRYKDCNFFYCITHYNALHISGSSINGPVDKKDLDYVFKKLTNKPIENFNYMKTSRALYLIEEKNIMLN